MTGYVADLSWKSGARAIEKLDRLRSTMAVNVLIVSAQLFEEISFSIFSADEFWGRKVLGNFEIVYKTTYCHIPKKR